MTGSEKAKRFSIIASLIIVVSSLVTTSVAADDTIFSDYFSGSHPGAWYIGHDGGGGSYSWAWPNDYAHEYADPSGGTYYYPNDLHVYMERRGVSLSGYNKATLSFSRIVDTEANYDEFTINVRDQWGTWHFIEKWSGITDPLEWTYTEVDLDQFAGQTNLYIQFRFDSDGSVSGSPYAGVYIDNVLLTASSSNTPPYINLQGPDDGTDTTDSTPTFFYEAGDSNAGDSLTVKIYISDTSSDPFSSPMFGYPVTTWTGSGGLSGSWTPSTSLSPDTYTWGMTISDGTETVYSEVRTLEIAPLGPALTASPTSVPADGTSTSTLTLSSAPAGHQVRLISSRGNLDTFSPASGTTDANGDFVSTVRSSTPGTGVIITAEDLTTAHTFATSASVTFTPVNGEPGPPPPAEGEVRIIDVSARHDLTGFFPIGLGKVSNQIDVVVDWGDKSPGQVLYQFNDGIPFEDTLSGNHTSHTFRFDQILQEGSNTLKIVAVAADGTTSDQRTYSLIGWTAESGWLQPLLAGLPYLGPDKVEFTVHIPGDPIDMLGLDVWLPGTPTKLGPQAVGRLAVPLRGGRYELDLGARFERSKSTPGAKPWYGRGALTLLGRNDLEVDFTGSLQGDLQSKMPFLTRPDLVEFSASGKVSFEVSESVIVVIQPIAPVGPVIVNGLKAVRPVYNWAKERAKFYIKLTPELGGDLMLNWNDPDPDLEPVSVALYVQIELEGGIKVDLYIAEGKVYLGGGSRIDFGLVPEFGVDKWIFYGMAGYELKAGWFKASHESKIEWVAYDSNDLQMANLFDALDGQEIAWSLIPRSYTKADYGPYQAFLTGVDSPLFAQRPGMILQGTTSTPLVSNVFPYAEPDLALRSDDQALLLWNYDDLNRPMGQGYDLTYSRWDGSAWSTPANVTDDTYPDASPQVVWLADGNALTVWERLDDPALPVDATLDVTQTRKMELAWATYDAASNTWNPPQWLTRHPVESNLVPVLSRAADGSVWVAWRNNPAGELSGDAENPGRIQVAHWNGGGWEAPQMVVSGILGIVDLALAHEGSDAVLAWTTNMTPTGSLTPTLQLFTSRYDGTTWSAPQQLTDDTNHHTNPQLIYRQGQPYVVWLAGDALTLQNLDALQAQAYRAATAAATVAQGNAITLDTTLQVDQFRVLQDSGGNLFVVFTGYGGSQRDLYLAYYDSVTGVWGSPQPLSNDRPSESYPAAGLNSSDQLLMAYSRTIITDEERTATNPDTGETITYTLPVEGQTDLYTLNHNLRRDLAVESLSVSDGYPTPGSTVTVSATLVNRGDVPLENVGFVFRDNGVDFDSRTVAGPLVAGEIVTLTAAYDVPTTGNVRTLTAVTDPDDTIIEIDETNNTVTLAVFGPDLELVESSVDHWSGSEVGLVSVVRNIGTTASPATTIAYYRDAITGTLLITDTVPTMAAGEAITITIPWDYGALAEGSYPLVAVVNGGEQDFAETFTDNNETLLILEVLPDLAVSPLYLWTEPLSDGRVVITGTVYNFGSVAAPPVEAAFYVDDPFTDTARINVMTLPELDAAGYAVVTATWNVPTFGQHAFYVTVNSGRTVTETTWSNNLASTYGASACTALGVDFDCSCAVDVADIMQVASRWRCRPGEDCYEELYDIDEDGDIDIVDIMKVVAHWGENCGAVHVTFDMLPDGTPITTDIILTGDEFLAKGISLAGAPESSYCADAVAAVRLPSYAVHFIFLTTSSPDDVHACNTVPIAITFASPVSRVNLTFAGASVTYTMKAYDSAGVLLGTAQQDAVFGGGTFEVTFNSGNANISRITFGHTGALTVVKEVYYQW